MVWNIEKYFNGINIKLKQRNAYITKIVEKSLLDKKISSKWMKFGKT